MTTELKATIIVPVVCDRGYLREALSTAMNQTLPGEQYEVVVVINGGKLTVNDITKYWPIAQDRPRLRVTSIKKNNLSSAINKGLLISQGRWFTVLPDDDTIHPSKLSIMIAAIQSAKQPIAGAYSLGEYFKSSGRRWVPKATIEYMATRLRLSWNNIGQKGLCIHGTGTLIETSIARQIGGWDESLTCAEEWEFHLRLLANGHELIAVKQALTGYRLHNTQKHRVTRFNRRKELGPAYQKIKEIRKNVHGKET